MYIRYLGHSGFQIDMGATLLIDPFFGNGLKEPCAIATLKPQHIKDADLILLTHEHPAHCDVNAVKEISERTDAVVVAPQQSLNLIELDEKRKVDVRSGDSFTLKNVDITVTKAVHPQSFYPVGYVVKNTSGSIFKFYHAGDTYQFAEMANINVDYAMIPIGGHYTMDPIDAANATKLFRAKFIIPMHYNTYSRIVQDVEDFKRRTRGKTIILQPDQSIEL